MSVPADSLAHLSSVSMASSSEAFRAEEDIQVRKSYECD